MNSKVLVFLVTLFMFFNMCFAACCGKNDHTCCAKCTSQSNKECLVYRDSNGNLGKPFCNNHYRDNSPDVLFSHNGNLHCDGKDMVADGCGAEGFQC